MVVFPPCASNFKSKNNLKSPGRISCFFGFVSNFCNSTNMLFSTSICSFWVLVLYKLTKMYSESLIKTSTIKMRPSLSVSCLLTEKSFCSKVGNYDITRICFSVRKKNLTFKVLIAILFDFTVRMSFL